MFLFHSNILTFFLLFCGLCAVSNIFYKDGGYTSNFCLENDSKFINESVTLNCFVNNNTCPNMESYTCILSCNFKAISKIGNKRVLLKEVPKPSFSMFSNKTKYYINDELTLTSKQNLTLLRISEVTILLMNEVYITCPIIKTGSNNITCRLEISQLKRRKHKVFVRYGYESCNNTIYVGEIQLVRKLTNILTSTNYLRITVVVVVIIILVIGFGGIIKIRKSKERTKEMVVFYEKKMCNQEIKYVNTQRKVFLEYQTAVSSFSDLGSITSRNILSFYNYTSRVFNVELSQDALVTKIYNFHSFETFILNKDKLLNWIDRIEKNCKQQQRSLVASLLTIVLFQHQDYFIEIIKCLLLNYIRKMKKSGDLRIIFRGSEAIVEKLIGNWISLCLYKSLRNGEVGKRFFHLYRALKSKMNEGIVDCLAKKAKYALRFDEIMLGDIDYEVVNIKANVNLELKLMDHLSGYVSIKLFDLEIQVLSLDSISQVKEKILDKAITVFSENENLQNIPENQDLCIEPVDMTQILLEFINSTTKITLNDYDRTSLNLDKDKNCIIINTMQHYNMKNGTTFLLSSVTITDQIQLDQSNSAMSQNSKRIKVHLHLPQDLQSFNPDLSKDSSSSQNSKINFNPMVEDTNKEAYLMRLLATKKSVVAFINGFFQCLLDYNPSKLNRTSSNSLFESSLHVSSSNIFITENPVTKDNYLTPIYFLFGILDDIARSQNITDDTAISLWKSNSLILRFWVNLIKNPNFIFSVDKNGPIDGSLTTIASVLMESCSMSASNHLVDMNLPIVKQLFLNELKEYASWWKMFIDSVIPVDDNTMIQQMKNIAETYEMVNHYNSSLKSLHAITIAAFPELLLE